MLSVGDAEVLAYLTPFAERVRSHSLDVQVVSGDSACLQPGFVSLDVISSRAFPGGGPEDHEYFAINLFTGQIYNPIPIPPEEITTKVILGVAKIIRHAHGITDTMYRDHSGLQPEIVGSPPCT